MSEDPQASVKPRRSLLSWAVGVTALVGVAVGLYIIAQSSTKTAPVVASVPLKEETSSFASKVRRPQGPTAPPDYTLYDAAGKPFKIANLKGKVVVLNVWATWCGPCKVEMPTLAKLQSAYAGKGVEVVVVSIDTAEKAASAALFIAQNDPLKFYHDREMKLGFKLLPPVEGMPTTVIYGRDGLEKSRVSGEADWTGPEARALVDEAVKGS